MFQPKIKPESVLLLALSLLIKHGIKMSIYVKILYCSEPAIELENWANRLKDEIFEVKAECKSAGQESTSASAKPGLEEKVHAGSLITESSRTKRSTVALKKFANSSGSNDLDGVGFSNAFSQETVYIPKSIKAILHLHL